MSRPESLTALDVANRLTSILHDLEAEPDAQGVTPLEAVQLLVNVERSIAAAVTQAMHTAQVRGHTLAEIGDAIGSTRQNVWNRLGRADLLAPR